MEILLAVFVLLLQVLDFYTTMTILNAGGVELNPIMRWLMEQIGRTEALVLAKVFATGAGAALYALDAVVPLAALAVFYLLVVIHNFGNLPK